MNAPRTLAVALLLVVGTVGFLGGLVVERTLLAEPAAAPSAGRADPAAADRARGVPGDRERSDDWRERVVRNLELSPEQAAELDRILEMRHEEMDRVMKEVRPRMREIVARTYDEILAILTPEQQEGFKAMNPHRDGKGKSRGSRR